MLTIDKKYALRNLSYLRSLPNEIKYILTANREMLKKDIETELDKLYSSINSSYEKMINSKNKIKQLSKDGSLRMNKKLLKLQKKGAKNIYKKDLKKWYQIIDVLLNPKITRLFQTEH